MLRQGHAQVAQILQEAFPDAVHLADKMVSHLIHAIKFEKT